MSQKTPKKKQKTKNLFFWGVLTWFGVEHQTTPCLWLLPKTGTISVTNKYGRSAKLVWGCSPGQRKQENSNWQKKLNTKRGMRQPESHSLTQVGLSKFSKVPGNLEGCTWARDTKKGPNYPLIPGWTWGLYGHKKDVRGPGGMQKLGHM